MLGVAGNAINFEGRGWLHSRGPLATQATGLLKMVEGTIIEGGCVCTRCGEEKAFTAYGKMAGNPAKKSNICKICVTAGQRKLAETYRRTNANGPTGPVPKICKGCALVKEPSEFGWRTTSRSGWDTTCLSCHRTADRIRYVKSSERRKETAKWGALKWKFGLTRQAWEAIFAAQDGCCAICSESLLPTRASRRDKRGACLDHDHRTQKVRGLLCARCNQGIGLLRDSVVIAEKAAAYLRKHSNE